MENTRSGYNGNSANTGGSRANFRRGNNSAAVNARSRTAGTVMSAGTAVPAAAPHKPAIKLDRRAEKQKKKEKRKSVIDFSIPQKFDFSFFLIVIVLMAFGLVMLFSSTYPTANNTRGDTYFFIIHQLGYTAVGLAAMIGISFIDYHFFMTKFIVRVGSAAAITLMVLVKFIGQTTNGSERWIEIFGIRFQPSEVLKLMTIIVIASYMQKNFDKLGSFVHGYIPVMLRIGVACALVAVQPHLSATLIILIISIALLFIGGAKLPHVLITLAGVAVAGVLVFEVFPKLGFDYVTDRLLSFRDPEADIQDKTYQTYQSLIAFGSGGFFGQGLGNSHQKYSYLPFTENDFIFSIIVEELGFVGAVVIILLFIILVVRGFYIAASAPDRFGMLLCAGIVIQIGVQAFLNIAVASNAFFNTGVSLPFFSYGGTALLMQLAEMGIVLNISRKASI